MQEAVLSWQLRTVEYLIYLEVFLVPLYVGAHHWNPFGTPKVLLMIGMSLVSVVLCVWAWGNNDRVQQYSFTIVHAALGVFLLALTISAFLGVDPANSFIGTFDQPIALVTFYALAIFSCTVGFLARQDPRFITRLVVVSFFGGVFVAILAYTGTALIPFSEGGSTLGNSSYLGAYLLFIVCFGIWIFFNVKKYWQKILTSVSVIVVMFSPVFFNAHLFNGSISISEALHHPYSFIGAAVGATLGLFVALVTILFIWMIRSQRKMVKIFGCIFFITLACTLFFVWYELVTPGTVIHDAYVEKKSENRFLFWNIADQGFNDRPTFGYGFGNYFKIYQTHFSADLFRPDHRIELWVNQPHNIALEYLSTGGAVGLIAFLVLFGVLLVVLFMGSIGIDGGVVLLPVIFFGVLCGEFFQNLFVFDTPATYLMLFLILGISSIYAPRIYVGGRFSLNKYIGYSVVILVTVVSISCIMIFVINPWRESLRMKQITSIKSIGSISKLIQGVQKISIMGNVRDTASVADDFAGLVQELKPKINSTNKQYVLDAVRAVEGQLGEEIKERPDNFRAQLVAGELLNLYLIINQHIDQSIVLDARSHLDMARNISPENVNVYMALAQNYSLIGDMAHARVYARAAIALAPDYEEVYNFAEQLNKIHPDNNFTKYIFFMKK